MSHGKIRDDKTCLNCGHHVEERFCPHCGQENTERRQPFYFLFTHFIEDFTHYDGQFWGTVKNLLFKPGKLTNTYLEGKRQIFVPPVKLYIFVSFITFFVFALFPMVNIGSSDKHNEKQGETGLVKIMKPIKVIGGTQKIIDSIKAKKILTEEDSLAIEKLKMVPDSAEVEKILDMDRTIDSGDGNYKSKKSYDSAKAKNPGFLDFVERPIIHKYFELKDHGITKKELLSNMIEKSFHNLPKALFIYLPLFAFFLWVFHNKKKWWYFDHGIFTLHYFSFLLLIILFIFLFGKLTKLTEIKSLNALLYFVMTIITIYSMGYFFIAHRRVYRSHGLVSIIVGIILFAINFFAFMFLLAGLALVSFMMLH